MTNHTGSVTAPALADSSCLIWNVRVWLHQRMVYARVTTSLGRTGDDIGMANSAVAPRTWKAVLPGKGMGLPESA